jgi:hypothetical protein
MSTMVTDRVAALHETYTDAVNRAVAEDRMDLVAALQQEFDQCLDQVQCKPPAEGRPSPRPAPPSPPPPPQKGGAIVNRLRRILRAAKTRYPLGLFQLSALKHD